MTHNSTSKMELAITDSDYRQWILDIESRFHQQHIKAAIHINSDKIEFYWGLGRDICEMQIEKRYGDGVIDALSRDLRALIPDAKGLTPVNLYYCKRFYSLYIQIFKKVPQLVEKSQKIEESDSESSILQKIPQVEEIFKPLH